MRGFFKKSSKKKPQNFIELCGSFISDNLKMILDKAPLAKNRFKIQFDYSVDNERHYFAFYVKDGKKYVSDPKNQNKLIEYMLVRFSADGFGYPLDISLGIDENKQLQEIFQERFWGSLQEESPGFKSMFKALEGVRDGDPESLNVTLELKTISERGKIYPTGTPGTLSVSSDYLNILFREYLVKNGYDNLANILKEGAPLNIDPRPPIKEEILLKDALEFVMKFNQKQCQSKYEDLSEIKKEKANEEESLYERLKDIVKGYLEERFAHPNPNNEYSQADVNITNALYLIDCFKSAISGSANGGVYRSDFDLSSKVDNLMNTFDEILKEQRQYQAYNAPRYGTREIPFGWKAVEPETLVDPIRNRSGVVLSGRFGEETSARGARLLTRPEAAEAAAASVVTSASTRTGTLPPSYGEAMADETLPPYHQGHQARPSATVIEPGGPSAFARVPGTAPITVPATAAGYRQDAASASASASGNANGDWYSAVALPDVARASAASDSAANDAARARAVSTVAAARARILANRAAANSAASDDGGNPFAVTVAADAASASAAAVAASTAPVPASAATASTSSRSHSAASTQQRLRNALPAVPTHEPISFPQVPTHEPAGQTPAPSANQPSGTRTASTSVRSPLTPAQ